MLAGLAVTVLVTLLQPGSSSSAVVPHPSASAAPATIYVHVLGAVSDPGLYRLTDGARVMDAVAAAGGFTADADQAGVNLARFVTDGEQVRVPTTGETTEQAQEGTDAGGLVNLNTASAEQLATLPRIGPALAQRIIAWRDDNGGFRSVDDLRSVSGIGEKTFAMLQELVTV
ncbi:competence protein ComEA [Paramicrobacterium humi]|uniref:Competence protein ComEA n=1 Tax=Paramicrobacterium humi TaxID=640635 RepID=A0A1H4QC28_9MICO|nr:competence protein ComEA [Microbacterium humi]